MVFYLQGRVFEPGLDCSLRARITSTSRLPLRSLRLNCMSPRYGDAKAWRETICPAPSPSTKLLVGSLASKRELAWSQLDRDQQIS